MRYKITRTSIIAPREIGYEDEENEPIVIISEFYVVAKSRKEIEYIVELNRIEDPQSEYEYKLIEKGNYND